VKQQQKEVERTDSAKKKEKRRSAESLASKWQQQMAERTDNENKMFQNINNDRVEKGFKWMDSQIEILIEEIKKYGRKEGEKNVVEFGPLFDKTQGTMSALSATLTVAKKKGVVDFEGDMLMQGAHDTVTIALLKESFVHSTPPVNVQPVSPRMQSQPQLGVAEKCVVCGKTAYQLERVIANDKVFHKGCFKCSVCDAQLKISDYAHLSGIFYCQPHYKELFNKKGDYSLLQ